jgi:endo-beta-N-acetylglucosaminidase D
LKYIDEQIQDVRRAIADVECSNKENDDNTEIQISMTNMIQQCNNLYEAHFLLEQMLQYAISKAADAAQNSSKIQILEAKISESENEQAINERFITDLINSNRRTHTDAKNGTFVILPTDTPKRNESE